VVLCWVWKQITGKCCRTFFTEAGAAVNGDDHLLGVPRRANWDWSFTNRSRLYAMVGLSLSKEKDFMSNSVEGAIFLGLRCVRNGYWFDPVFRDSNKLLCALVHYDSKRSGSDPEVVKSRLINFRYLSAFDDGLFYIVDSVCHLLTNIKWEAGELSEQTYYQSFWRGLDEGSYRLESAVGPLKL